jgi:hypothetical protein
MVRDILEVKCHRTMIVTFDMKEVEKGTKVRELQCNVLCC